MQPGPIQIVACPHCAGLAKYMTLASGNTFGAHTWTDGKRVAPMLPTPPAVVKCRHCPECYWLSDAKTVGEIDLLETRPGRANRVWENAQLVEEPTEQEYYVAIDCHLATNASQEKRLRILAWWRSNDLLRESPTWAPSWLRDTGVVSARHKNLEALTRLLDDADENDRIMKAEIQRERGEFASAIDVLSTVTSTQHAPVVHQLRSLCISEDTCVRELRVGA